MVCQLTPTEIIDDGKKDMIRLVANASSNMTQVALDTNLFLKKKDMNFGVSITIK